MQGRSRRKGKELGQGEQRTAEWHAERGTSPDRFSLWERPGVSQVPGMGFPARSARCNFLLIPLWAWGGCLCYI